ncbi:MAG: hypothetical protein ABEJ79_05155 [Halolamina sp.]
MSNRPRRHRLARLARFAAVAGAVGLGAAAVAVVVAGPARTTMALTAVGATLLGAGGGALASLSTEGGPADDGDSDTDPETTGAVTSALGGGETFERPAAKRNGDGDATDGERVVAGDEGDEDADTVGTEDGDDARTSGESDDGDSDDAAAG